MIPSVNVFVKCPKGHKILSPVFVDFKEKWIYIYCDKCKDKVGWHIHSPVSTKKEEKKDAGKILHP